MNVKALALAQWTLGVCVLCALVACNDTPMAASMEKAQNDDVEWKGRTIAAWRWDLRAISNAEKASRASMALMLAGEMAVPGLSKDVLYAKTPYVNMYAALALLRMDADASDALPSLRQAIVNGETNDSRRHRIVLPVAHAAIVRITGDQGDHINKIKSYLHDANNPDRDLACHALQVLKDKGLSEEGCEQSSQ